MKAAYEKAQVAINLEINEKDQKAAISKWRDVFGTSFPTYTGY